MSDEETQQLIVTAERRRPVCGRRPKLVGFDGRKLDGCG